MPTKPPEDPTAADTAPLPGEDGPLTMRRGGAPITDQEALGVAKRLARLRVSKGRTDLSNMAAESMPAVGEATAMAAWRIDAATLYRARARAEMENTTVSAIVNTLLRGWAEASPGSVAVWVLPDEPVDPTP